MSPAKFITASFKSAFTKQYAVISHDFVVNLTTSLNGLPVRSVREQLLVVDGEEVALEAVGVAEGLRAQRAEEQPRADGRPQRGHGGLAKLLSDAVRYDVHKVSVGLFGISHC